MELALLGAPTYAEQYGLANPCLAVGATKPYVVPREVVAFGHVLYEMATGRELTDAELSHLVGMRVPGPTFPGPPPAWAILEKIFLPAPNVAKGPTLVEVCPS